MESNVLFEKIKGCRDSNGVGGALSTRTICVMTPDSDLLDILSVTWDADNNAFILTTEWVDE